jgi:predicted dehydrogenase
MALRVAIAGVGQRGRDWIREVKNSPGFELVGCIDADDLSLKKALSESGLAAAQCFSNLDQALEQTTCDCLIVATPVEDHRDVCDAALSRRIAVLVEKPFTLTLPDAVRLVALADEQQTPLLVAQNYRYMRSFRTVRRVIEEGTLGTVGMIVCQYFRPPHDLAASLARLSHSVLWGMGVHHLDALRHMLKQEAVSVTAESFTSSWGSLPPGASLRVMLTFDGGTRASYSATYESSGHEFFERGQEFYARFVGERATLHMFQRWLILCENGRLPRIVRRGSREVSEEQILLRQLENAIVNGEPAEISGRDNLKTMAILEACVRSATEHRAINPQELLNEVELAKTSSSHRY